MFEIPNPVAMYEAAKNAGLERDVASAFVSTAFSAVITFMWRSGSAKWADFTGEAQALKDAATSMYLSLTSNPHTNFLTLTVPQDLLAASNTSRFQTQYKKG